MDEFTSIVVLGAMNPRIHHPHWYFAQELITASERDAALAAPLVCTPPVAQFRAPEFAVACGGDRWEIQTSLPESVDRVRAVAARVFTILNETPVTAFGFNVNAQIATTCDSVGAWLAQEVAGTALELELQEGALNSAQVIFQVTQQGRRFAVNVSPSGRGPEFVQVATNTHYEMSGIVGPGEFFNLEQMIEEHFAKDRATALTEINKIATSIGQKTGECLGH